MKKHLLAAMAALTLSVALFAGCGSNDSSQTDGQVGTPTEDQADIQTDAQTKDQIISDEEVETGAVTEERVVASSVAVVEILDALGVPVVGVPTSSYELPESAKDATEIGNPMSPDLEVIASLEPTIIISVDSLSTDLAEQFENLGAESAFVNLSSYDGLKETITTLGERFGVQEKAQEILAGFEEKEKEIAAEVEGEEAPTVLIIFGANNNFMTATESTYVGDLAKRVGAVNILAGTEGTFIPVDMEYLAGQNPEYILFMAHANPEESLEAFKQEFETNEAWQNFDAVKNGNVYALETGYFGMSANLLATDAMDKLAELLYGQDQGNE